MGRAASNRVGRENLSKSLQAENRLDMGSMDQCVRVIAAKPIQ